MPQISDLGCSPHDTVWLDAAVTGGIKDVRLFSSQLLLAPQFGTTRLGVIDHAEWLTPEAQNALLKTLEEPPASVKMVLLVETEARVLPTVLSRCRKLVWARSSEGEIVKAASGDSLVRFLEAEALAKDEGLRGHSQGQLAMVYQRWVESGRVDSGIKLVEKTWQLYHNLETQINKRLLLEQYVLELEVDR